MRNISRTTLRELKKRYLNILKKCFLANLLAFSCVLPSAAEETLPTGSLGKIYRGGGIFILEEVIDNALISENGKKIYNISTDDFLSVSSTSMGDKGNSQTIIIGTSNLENGIDRYIIDGGRSYNEDGTLNNAGYTLFLMAQNDFGTLLIKNLTIKNASEVSLSKGKNYIHTYENLLIKNSGGILNGSTANLKNVTIWGAHSRAFSMVYNTSVATLENVNFLSNKKGAIGNVSNMTINGISNFKNNITENDNDGAAIANSGKLTIETVNFIGNITKGTHGGAISSSSTSGLISFNGQSFFEGNKLLKEQIGQGGAIYNAYGSNIQFNAPAIFISNFSMHDGGAIFNEHSGKIVFNDEFYFIKNNAKYMGDDILNRHSGSVINFSHGLDDKGKKLIGVIDTGIVNSLSDINKTGKGTLIFGDLSVNSGTGTFNQTEGTTISKNNNFLNGTNLINGGTLSIHGEVPTFTATLGNVIDDEGNKTASGTFELQSNVNEGLNISAVTDKIKVAEDATGTKIILGAYRDVEKTVHENLIKDKTVKITNEDGTVTERSLETLEYVDENGEKQEYDVVAGLFNTTTLGTANAKYHLDGDVGAEGNTISFENSDITFGLNEYKNGTYELTNSTVVNLQNESIEEQSVTFADLDGSGATLSIDIALLKDSEGKTQLTADRLNLTSDGKGYKFAGVSFNTPMDGQALLDEILSGLTVGQDGTITPSIKHTVQVLGGNASFMGRKEATLSTASPYVYEVLTAGQDLTVSADVLKGSALEYLNDTDTDVTLKIAEKGDIDYTVTEDLGTMGCGKKQILGSTSVATESVINANGKELFTLNNKDTSLTIKDVTITGAKEFIDNKVGSVSLENVVLNGSTGETAITNASELTLKDVSVDKGVVNSGKLTMSGNNALTTLTNSGETTVEGGKLSVTTLGGNGTLTMNGAELDSTNIATNNTIVSNGMSLSNGLTTFEVKSLEVKEGTTLDLNLAMTTADKIKNEGDMIANKDLSVGALEGTGTLTVNNATLNVADKFKTTNKIVSNGMKIGDNVTSEIHFADLKIKDNTTLDIKTLQATANTVTVGENATLGITLKNLDEYGTMKADEIIAKEDSKVHLTLGDNFAGGVFDVFKGTKGSGDLELVHNNVYNVVEVSEGKYSFMAKDTEALQESLGTTDNETVIANALTQGTTSHAVFSRMQSEMLVALQSQDAGTVAKAKKALSAVGSTDQSAVQSVTTEHIGAIFNVVKSEMPSAISGIGRSGGEEETRAKVYIKGLYDQTKSTMGEGFKARSKGTVLGVQSQISEDLTVGVGYAFSNTIAKEDLRRTEADTNTAFASVHYQPNAWWMSGLATYSRANYDEKKEILSTTGTANYNLDSWGIQVMTGYDIKLDRSVITPEVGIRYLSLKQEGYTDTLGTTVEGTKADYVTAMIGVRGMLNLGAIRPTAGFSIGYDVVTDDISAVNTLANGASYTVNSEKLDKLSTIVTLGFKADISKNTSFSLEYSGTFRKEYQDHSGMLRFNYSF